MPRPMSQLAACVKNVRNMSLGDDECRLVHLQAALKAKQHDMKASNNQMKKWCRRLGICAGDCNCYYRELPAKLLDNKRLRVRLDRLKHTFLRYIQVGAHPRKKKKN